jgi:hypothetical protein
MRQQKRQYWPQKIDIKCRKEFFGRQNDLAYGVNWKYKTQSDVKDVTGDYPAVWMGSRRFGKKLQLILTVFLLTK